MYSVLYYIIVTGRVAECNSHNVKLHTCSCMYNIMFLTLKMCQKPSAMLGRWLVLILRGFS